VTWVVDSSVVVKWYVAEDYHRNALNVLGSLTDRVAPDILVYEVCNIFWRKLRQGEVSQRQAEVSITEFLRENVQFWPGEALAMRAFDISRNLQHPVYDCFYLACAEVLDATLVTADDRFLAALRETDFAGRGCHIADV